MHEGTCKVVKPCIVSIKSAVMTIKIPPSGKLFEHSMHENGPVPKYRRKYRRKTGKLRNFLPLQYTYLLQCLFNTFFSWSHGHDANFPWPCNFWSGHLLHIIITSTTLPSPCSLWTFLPFQKWHRYAKTVGFIGKILLS